MNVENAYGWLLQLYPVAFRDEYGDEMRFVFQQVLDDAR